MKRVLLVYTKEDSSYLTSFAKAYIPADWKLGIVLDTVLGSSVGAEGLASKYDAIISDSEIICKLVFSAKNKVALGNYIGSWKILPSGIPFLVIPKLENKYKVPYQDFLTKRLLQKIFAPQTFIPADRFRFHSPTNTPGFFTKAQAAIASAKFMAADTETLEDGLRINVMGITTWAPEIGSQSFSWYVRDEADLALAKVAMESPAVKIFQNGKYDFHYLARFELWPENWRLDTLNMFNCWLAELPKDLAFITAFCIKDFYYWKDEAKSMDSESYLRYNGKDTYSTLWSAFSLLRDMPGWAKDNYAKQFPKVFPNLSSSLQGMRVDLEMRTKLYTAARADIAAKVQKLQVLTGCPTFNPNSPQQVQRLLKVLGVKDSSSGDAKHIKKAMAEHPLNERVLTDFSSIKEESKLASTYYGASLFGDRIMWNLNEAGTDTGRNSCQASSFWCGTQFQNQPEEAKVMYLADEGWEGGEADFSQAESRCTGYLADDEPMIKAVETSPDFHSANASAFFGVPFDQIWNTELGKTINKALRDLSKRVNHGANYNMGPAILVETMGVENIWKAHELLGLAGKFPKRKWDTKAIAEYLLERFDATYPRIRGAFQDMLKEEILLTGLLVNVNGWTRKVFGDPRQKNILNAVVAHKPQNLSALTLNDAFEEAWWKLHDPNNFRLIVSIHDSILFQYKGEEGKAKIPQLIKIMTRPITIPYTGKTFTIPPAVELWGTRWKKPKGK